MEIIQRKSDGKELFIVSQIRGLCNAEVVNESVLQIANNLAIQYTQSIQEKTSKYFIPLGDDTTHFIDSKEIIKETGCVLFDGNIHATRIEKSETDLYNLLWG